MLIPCEVTHTQTHTHTQIHTCTYYTYDSLSDVKTVNLELGETMRQHRKGSDFGAGLECNKSLMAEIEEKTVTLGRKTRTEVSGKHNGYKECVDESIHPTYLTVPENP